MSYSLPSDEVPPFPTSRIAAANVSSVKQRSPLRYPGGKTWLIPHIQEWLHSIPYPQELIEPFCGGGIVSLTAAAEDLAGQCLMADIDPDVAAFWKAALHHRQELCDRIADFEVSRDNVVALESSHHADDVVYNGFRTLVLNRTRRGGILTPGASFIHSGENGKGIASRWYPQTLITRLVEIEKYARARKITFSEKDGMSLLEAKLGAEDTVTFVDPPYTAGGKQAGSRLYQYSEIDHSLLFEILADSSAEFLMTYDASPEIISLVRQHGFHAVTVAMKNTHHARIPELIITNRPMFPGE